MWRIAPNKENHMKYYLGIILMTLSFSSLSQEKESFLAAWENTQNNSEEVALFERLDEKKYRIKFTTLPYEGELLVFSYGVDDIDYGLGDSVYTKSGYVEVDLPGAPEDMMVKYNI